MIYAIYSTRSRKLYVGQTKTTCKLRFEQHVHAARRGEVVNQELYARMRKWGIDDFHIFPLEKIPDDSFRQGSKAQQMELFRKAATPREIYWINKLGSGRPRGFNIQFVAPRRHRKRDAQNNRLKKRPRLRSPRPPDPVPPPPVPPPAPPPIRRSQRLALRAGLASAQPVPQGRPVAVQPAPRIRGYRNWKRRAEYLLRVLREHGALSPELIRRYKLGNLWKILRYMENEERSKSPARLKLEKQLIAELRNATKLRVTQRPTVVDKARPFLRLQWSSTTMRSLKIRAALRDPETLQFVPNAAFKDTIAQVRVVNKLNGSIFGKVSNFASAARHLRAGVEAPSFLCPCRRAFARRFRPDDGCVFSCDTSIAFDKHLKELLERGPKFRESEEVDVATTLKACLNGFIEANCEAAGLRKSDLAVWRDKVIEKCEASFRASGGRCYLDSDLGKASLRYLHRYLVVVPVDKAANNLAFVCKRAYWYNLHTELSKADGAYEPCGEPVDQVLARHKAFCQRFHLPSHDSLPYLYYMPKFHKQGSRFIAGGTKVSTKGPSKCLVSILSAVSLALREKDDKGILATGVRRYFVVNSYDEVVSFLKPYTRSRPSDALFTGDFSTLYTTLPLDDVLEKLKMVIAEAWVFQEEELGFEPLLEVDKSKSTWVRQRKSVHNAKSQVWDQAEVVELVQFVLENTFIKNGDALRRQKMGIPMGTNAAPLIANLYLYAYESSYIDRLVEQGQLDDARGFHLTFRLIDDVLSLDNALFKAAVMGDGQGGDVIYPPALKLNETTVGDGVVHFLGMDIRSDGGILDFDVFDKREEFKFQVRNYLWADSAVPACMLYGVFIGQLHRYHKICSTTACFTTRVRKLIHTLLKQGYCKRRLARTLFSFLRHHPPPSNIGRGYRHHIMADVFDSTGLDPVPGAGGAV